MSATPRGFIVLLNGCSSAGKTSLAHALQAAAPDLQFLHVALDAFRRMEPADYWAPDRKPQWPARIAALCHAINATAAQYTQHGQNVILDHVLSDDAWTYLRTDLAAESVYLVRVDCPLAVAEAREAARPDRAPGLARSQWSTIHAARDYDVAVDTATLDPAAAAGCLLGWLRAQPRPAAFATRCAPSRAA